MALEDALQFACSVVDLIEHSLLGSDKNPLDASKLLCCRRILEGELEIENSENSVPCVVVKYDSTSWQMAVFDSPETNVFSSTGN